MDDSCTQGVISDAQAQSQIDILNEDFLALPGTNGANGTDLQVQFVLASEDPDGFPTTGMTRDCSTTWFNDGGTYWNTLAWDPHRYMNIYTNQASGALGYVPFLPADGGGGNVGQLFDRVVILWSAFGRETVAQVEAGLATGDYVENGRCHHRTHHGLHGESERQGDASPTDADLGERLGFQIPEQLGMR